MQTQVTFFRKHNIENCRLSPSDLQVLTFVYTFQWQALINERFLFVVPIYSKSSDSKATSNINRKMFFFILCYGEGGGYNSTNMVHKNERIKDGVLGEFYKST